MDLVVRLKLIVVGNGNCGKTSLLTEFCTRASPGNSTPTTFINHVVDIKVDGKQVQLVLWDTPGQDETHRLVPLIYPHSDIIIVCFSIDQPGSLENVIDKWVPEVIHFCSNPPVPYILVGCKKDLRTQKPVIERLGRTEKMFVMEERGKKVARSVGAINYIECSSLTGEGVDEVFQNAARAAILGNKGSDKKHKCMVL